MITVILEDHDGNELQRVACAGNEVVLFQQNPERFPLLSELDSCSYGCFSCDQMPDLLRELERAEKHLAAPELSEHIRQIREMAEKCKFSLGATLSFTPFGE